MSSASRPTRREGPELPPTRPTLAMTHLELGSLGEEIIMDIMEIADEGKLFEKVVRFVGDALAIRGPNDGVAY